MKKRICELAPREVFNLIRHPEETYVCVERGDILRMDGMEHHYHGLSHIEVIGQFDTAQMAALEVKRHPWKPENVPEPANGEVIAQYKETIAVLTSELATLKMETEALRKLLYHVAHLLPEPTTVKKNTNV